MPSVGEDSLKRHHCGVVCHRARDIIDGGQMEGTWRANSDFKLTPPLKRIHTWILITHLSF